MNFPLIHAAYSMSKDERNNLMLQLREHILIAILVIGAVGLLIEQGMTFIANRFDYRTK